VIISYQIIFESGVFFATIGATSLSVLAIRGQLWGECAGE
jgi:hypothetical protein